MSMCGYGQVSDLHVEWSANGAPSTAETIPHRLLGVAVLNVGELDMGDSSVTNTRCAFAVMAA